MHVEPLDVTDAAVASQVLVVQRAAYRVEAEIVGSTDIPPLHESLDDLMATPLQWRGIRDIDGDVVAAIALTVASDCIDIDRLIVAPDHMRRGHASALLMSLDARLPMTVSTGKRNGPARQLYQRHGFVAIGETEAAPGLWITSFRRGSR